MTGNEERLRQKEQFYDELDALNRSDDTTDPGRAASEAAWKVFKDVSRQVSRVAHTSLPRSSSDTAVVVKAPTITSTTTASNERPSDLVTLERSVSDIPKMPTSTKITGKWKRESAAALVPEEQQVFKNLHFYFFPNNDNNPARRMRISKAVQFGATWKRDWDSSITHVVLDKEMTFEHLLKYLKLDRLPEAVIAVPEHYPSECLSYRALLDHKQNRFQIKGYKPAALSNPRLSSSTRAPLQEDISRRSLPRHLETPEDQGALSADAVEAQPGSDALEEVQDDTTRIADSFPKATTESTIDFDEVIQRAKELAHLPLEDEEGDSRPTSAHSADSGDEKQNASLQLLNQRKGKFRTMTDKFACMQKHTGAKSDNPNQATIDILQKMADYYGQTGDEWRVRAYRKAISTLRAHPMKVCSKEEAAALPNIGGRLAEKIEEIAMTNRLRRLDSTRAEPGDTVLRTFMGVYGAGIVQATRWVDQGFKTLDELLEKAALTTNQRIGIEHYEDFNSRIPRAEVERHGDVARRALQAIDPAFRVIVGGSYRRGSEDSGDIDCIITRPDTDASYLAKVVLGKMLPRLKEKGFIVANLAVTSKDDGSKWHGASCLPGSTIWRRLDLLLVPSDELGAALIYFTGDDIFNRSIRLLASTKGMRLNQRGLYRDVLRGPQRTKLTEGILVEGKDERRIFEILGVPWRPPEQQIC